MARPGDGPDGGAEDSSGRRTTQEAADLQYRELRPGHGPGSRYVRIVRPRGRQFRREAPGYLVASERMLAPHTMLGRAWELARFLLVGRRIPTEQEIQERAGKLKALAIFASDNISSSAYATEEVMRVLILAGAGALALTLPITLAIVLILAIVVISYRQVIRAYPSGGGSYVVAHDNLGPLAGLTAAAALLTDYILTAAVSISAGVAAIASAFPELLDHRVTISVAVIVIMAIMNLRGIRESGNIFAAPTYVYLFAILGLIGLGIFRSVTGTLPQYAAPPESLHAHGAEPVALLLVLRAFASGSVALTGTEAVSNGVPAFKPPEVRNAQVVLVAMGSLFASIFVGMSLLATQLGIIPDPEETETVVSQLTRTLVGEGTAYYYLVQISIAVLLLLAANTAFNGFPLLGSILARDKYLPRQFQFRGDRLAFSAGIAVLTILSAALVIAFRGSVTNLIPLYTVGVFLAFTLSQMGLVRHWWQVRAEERGWRSRASVNGIGAAATGIVLVVVAVSKFALGAWMVLVLIPLLIAMMWGISRHYRHVEDVLTPQLSDTPPTPDPPDVIVPVSRIDLAALHALSFARSISPNVTAVHITDDPAEAEQIREGWDRWARAVPLVIVESPYRALLPPLLAYIDARHREDPARPITVVLAEFVPEHIWEYVLHNQTTLRLKLALFFRPNTVVVDVPYHPRR